jgi:hypothetical protein
VLQQEAILELIGLIKHDPSKVFNSARVFNTPYQGFSDQRPYDLLKFFHELYRQGFKKFDSQTNEIFTTYLAYCARIFDEVACPEDKKSFSTQARFLTISVCFGVDRALTGLKTKDRLFREFQFVAQDNYHPAIYDKEELVRKVPELPFARELYSDFFRTDEFNPQYEEKIPLVGAQGISYAEVTHHGFSTPVQHARFSLISPFFKNSSPDKVRQFDYSSQDQQDICSSQNPGNDNPGPTSSTSSNQSSPSATSSSSQQQQNYARGSDNISDSEQECLDNLLKMPAPRTRATGASDQHQTSRGRPRSRQQFSEYVQRRTYTPESDTDSMEDSDSNYSDPIKPKIPLHQQSTTGTTGAYFGDRLSTAGHVYDQSRSHIRRSSRKNGFINNIATELEEFNLDEQQKAAVLGTSLGIAHSINAFTKEGQRLQRDSIKHIPPPPDDLDLRVDSFDYDREGKTAEEILGRRFSRMNFPSEAVRLSTLRSIFSRVVDDPASSNLARHIALNQLGQFDHPKLTKQEVEHYISRSISRLDHHHDSETIPPPVLGNNSFDNKLVKTLQTRIGMPERFSFDELNPALLRNILNSISAVITNAGLREEEAYAFMRTLTKGITYETMMLSEFEHQTPFSEFWLSIQKTQKRTSSAREHEKKLKQLLQSDRVENLEKTLNEIMVCTFKTHENELDPSYRKLLTQRECLKNFRFFIRKHYSPYFSQINTCFMDRLRQVALDKNDPSFTNENIFHHQKVQIFLEIACEILAQYEPEELPTARASSHRQNTYIHAMDAQEQRPPSVQQAPNHQQQQHDQQRPPSRFNQRSGTPGPNQQRRNGSYNPQQQQRNRPRTPGPQRQRPLYSCFLCNIQGHSFRDCKKYSGQEPSRQFCSNCGGTHQGECKSRPRPQTPGPSNQIAAFEAGPAPPQQAPPQPNFQYRPQTPYQGQYQGYQNRQNYQQRDFRPQSRGPYQQNRQWEDRRPNYQNDQRGRTPYRNNDQRQYQSNNQGYFRSQSRNGERRNYNNYRNDGRQSQNGQRDFRPRSQSGYRNDGRRSQSGYRNSYNSDRRNYNDRRYNGNSSNYTPIGQRHDNRGYDRNNGYNNSGQQDPDNGRTTPFFKSSYYNQSNTPAPPKDNPQPTVNGIGNTGYQPIPLSARLSALAAEEGQ